MQPNAHVNSSGLPKAFLHSIRTLFDILDDGNRGYVRISDLENHWKSSESPAGVLESLKRVAPQHGCLSFERFVLGLRNSMLWPENSDRTSAVKCCSEPAESQVKVRPLGVSNTANTEHARHTRHVDQNQVHAGGIFCFRTLHNESISLPRSQSETLTGLSRRHGRNQDEHRRHTVTNGVDYGMLKQMKELEQEKDSLLAGLDVLDRAREWYQTQIHNVIETQRHVGQSHSTVFSTGSCQNRIDVLLPKLQDVTRCLSDLISFQATTFPSVSSAIISPLASVATSPQAIQILKEQNRLLTQEVSEKSDRITQLEQEKSALIKQLFEARARNAPDNSILDSTFI